MLPPPPRSTLFPYTTLFRSGFHESLQCPRHDRHGQGQGPQQRHQPVLLQSQRQQHRLGQRLQFRRRSEEHTSELQSRLHLVCRLLLEKKKKKKKKRSKFKKQKNKNKKIKK